jgi:DNA-binding XRE family transcriptional regulator
MTKTGKELLSEAIERHNEVHRLIEIRKETESYWREQIAKEIEAMKHTIVTIEGGINSHSLSECRSMRQQDYDLAQARYAAIARGKND